HVGMFARSVADLELLRAAMGEAPIKAAAHVAKYRIGVVRDFFFENATAEMAASVEALANRLPASGFAVAEARLPAIFAQHQEIMRTILQSETATAHRKLFVEHRETYAPKIRAVVENGLEIRATDYV